AGARHVEWRGSRGIGPGVLPEALRLAAVLRAVRPDLVHLHSSKAGLAGRVLPRRGVTIFQPHCWSFESVRGPVRTAAVRGARSGSRRRGGPGGRRSGGAPATASGWTGGSLRGLAGRPA